MKKFFNLTAKFTFLFAILFSVFAMAQTTESTETVSIVETIKSGLAVIFLPALLASALALFSDAAKYFNSPDWSWEIFMSTKLKPFAIITCIAFIAVLLRSILSDTLLSIFGEIGSELMVLSSATLFGFATALYDNFSKVKK